MPKSFILVLLCVLALLAAMIMLLDEEKAPGIDKRVARRSSPVANEPPEAISSRRRSAETEPAPAEPASQATPTAETSDLDPDGLTPELARLQRILASKMRRVGLDDRIVLEADATRLEELREFSTPYFDEREEIVERCRKLLSKRVDEKLANNQIEVVRGSKERQKDLPDQHMAVGTRYVDGKRQDFVIRVNPGEVPEADALRRQVKALDEALGRAAHDFLWAAARKN